MGPSPLKSAALLTLSALSALAQFHDLAVTDDASQVYFATSLRLFSESSQHLPNTAAIYRISNGVIQRLTVPPGPNPLPYHVDSHGNPQVSADARVFSYTDYSNCYGGSACISYPPTSTSFLTVDGKPYGGTLQGEAQVSRNGRYELNALRIAYLGNRVLQTVELRDLQTGLTSQPSIMPANRRQALTSDGKVLTRDPQTGALAIWTPHALQSVTTAETPWSAILDDAARWVVYEAHVNSQVRLRAVDLGSGADVLLATRTSDAFSITPFHESLSGDGTALLYLAEPQSGRPVQAWIVRPDGTARRQLTTFPEGVTDAVLSGNGQTVAAVTGGRLVSIDVATAAVRELIGVTPTCAPGIFGSPVPGSLYLLTGTALAASTEIAPIPLPSELGGAKVLMNGAPLPLLSVAPSEIWLQVPFDAAPGASVTLSLTHGSPFNGCSLDLKVAGRSPWFFPDAVGTTLAVHGDFSALVSQQAPARPGEVVVLYALGLGGVAPPMATGVPTPYPPLFPLDWPFGCYLPSPDGNGPPLDVEFAGLAPGMIGIYQVNVRMPDPLPAANWLYFNCGTPGNPYERGGASIPIPPAP